MIVQRYAEPSPASSSHASFGPTPVPDHTTRVTGPTDTIIQAIQRGDVDAFNQFRHRFLGLLKAYAKRCRIPAWDADACIQDVLSDEFLRLSQADCVLPRNLEVYLIRVLRHRYLNTVRAAVCRDRYQSDAASEFTGEWVVASLCSEYGIRSSRSPDESSTHAARALQLLASDLGESVTEEEQNVLTWLSQGVTHGEIAKWMGVKHDAMAKRIWRLCRRLRARAESFVTTCEPAERLELERFLRRTRSQEHYSANAAASA
jgi:DNA-directed RNA polymerase specialized sigma24 family protein